MRLPPASPSPPPAALPRAGALLPRPGALLPRVGALLPRAGSWLPRAGSPPTRAGALLALLIAGAAALAGGACDRGRGGSAAFGTGSGSQAAGGAPPVGASAATSASAATGAPAQAPRRGGTLVTGWTAEPGGVNTLITPATAILDELSLQLFLRLVEEQSDFESRPPTFAPSLASSYEWSPDHKTLTFHLRDARWSDGVPVTADDVRWTWQAETSPEVAWSYATMKAEIADVEVVDPHTARFHFKRVYAKQLLDVNEGGILPRHVWGQIPFSRWRQSGDWFLQHLVVDGPFTVESWKRQQELVLRRNPRYHDPDDPQRPYLDRVVMRIVPDMAGILTQLDSGDLDYAPVISPGAAPRIRANPRLQLLPYWFRTWVGIAWNNTRQPFSDPGVRRALSLALDRQTIVDTTWKGYARVCDSPILASVWAHDRALRPLPYDPAEARRILATKGFTAGPDGVLRRGGKPFEFELTTNAGNQQRVDALVMIQEQLRRIGVRVKPRQVEFNTLNAQVDAGAFDATLTGTTMDTSLDLSSPFHSREIGDKGTNITRYSNPEVDRLIDHAMSLPEIALAKPDLDRLQEILQRDQPYTFLWDSERLSAFSRRLHGVKPSPLFSFIALRNWWIEAPAQR